MLYHEFSLQPNLRSGLMVPESSLPDLFKREDSGYCSVYKFDEKAVFAIRAQGSAKGLGRFPVYSDRLWIDIDRDDKDGVSGVERARAYARELANKFKQSDYNFTVWFSGSKGFHICIKITMMVGEAVPHSQAEWLRAQGLEIDYSLYQHGRLLSNPGRLHPKTGKKKELIMVNNGTIIPTIPILSLPIKTLMQPDELSKSDLARIVFSRASNLILDAPLCGMRHTSFWSFATQALEAGLPKEWVFGTLSYVNEFLPDPKSKEDILRSIEQAQSQLGL